MPDPIIIILLFSLGLIGTAIVLLIVLWLLSGAWNIIGGNLRLYSGLLFFSYILLTGGVIGLFLTPITILALPWLIAIFIVVADSVRYHRRAQQHALLWSMAISAEKNIPLSSAIEAFAREGSGLINLKARQLAALLESGLSLPEAIEHVPGLLPPRLLPIIRVGHESGALAKALRQALSASDAFAPIWNSFFNRLLYIALIIFLGISILVFMMIKIVPSLEKIFKDFGSHLPWITRLLIGVSHFCISYLGPLLFLILLGLIIYALSCTLGWVPFYFPGLTRIMRRQHTAVILDSLALAAEYNRPLDGILSTMADSYPQRSVRKKLKLVGSEVAQGKQWCESLCQHGLIKAVDKAVIEAAQRVGNLPWALRETAQSNRRRLIYRLQAGIQLLYPPLIVCLGAIVMFIVVSTFFPLIFLIKRLALP